MAKRTTKKNTIQVFIVSWFPIGVNEAMTIRCLSRESAARIVNDLETDFAKYPNHKPVIHVDRGEMIAAY